MNKPRFLLKAAAFIIVVLASASSASAQASRTWVSGVGDDANPCSRTAPCKTFAGAISKTADGGEISVLDPGGYGALTITKGITVDGAGTLGSTLSTGGFNGIVINEGTNTKSVTLRNLSISGGGSATLGLNGIRVLAARSVHVENVVISNYSNHGIDISRTAATNVEVMVKRTTIQNCGGNAIGVTNTGTGQVVLSVGDSKLQRCANGISTGARSRVMVSNTEITHNTSNGITNTAADSIVNAESVVIAFHPTAGIASSGGADRIVRISRCAVTQNGTGLSTSGGGVIESAGNNFVFGNGTNGAPTSSPGQS